MTRCVAVNTAFESVWPQVPDRLVERWRAIGDVEYVRLDPDDDRPVSAVLDDPAGVEQLVALGVPVTDDCVAALSNLEEATVMDGGYGPDAEAHAALEAAGVTTHFHESEGFWSQSVAELALGITVAAMRRIPDKHRGIVEGTGVWDRDRWAERAEAGYGGFQGTADTPFWTHGTVDGTRLRAVGVGNIGSRYLDVMEGLGADVAAYDPYADEPCFHRAGVRQVHRLEDAVDDAEIFAPLVPLTDETEGLIDRDLVARLPEGCLVVLVTRAGVTDFDAVRERVLADELALAADVFDEEPLEPTDPLVGRDNVVHTPHVAGRTEEANDAWARMLLARFSDSGVDGPD
ncbi:MAG: NAD(P)-dependent oxidoreductase [Haloarculaceae archaeon]